MFFKQDFFFFFGVKWRPHFQYSRRSLSGTKMEPSVKIYIFPCLISWCGETPGVWVDCTLHDTTRYTKEPRVGCATAVLLAVMVTVRLYDPGFVYTLFSTPRGQINLLEHAFVVALGGVERTVCFAAGKRAFFRNGAAALTVSAGVVYGVDWFKRRMIKKSQGWREDSGAPRS